MENFILYLSAVRWQDLIDIGINSYILFRLYVLFKGTNVFRVLIGIALLWFFQRVAASLGLIVTSWAIQGITAAAALIIIVIFRNEIRTVLQAKNLRALLWSLPGNEEETPLDIIAESTFDLAKKGTGALIVISGKEDLQEAVHSGIPWQGRLSKEMIGTIFWNGNPVHDGAAIIQDGRVAEVGVILPLSRQKDLPSHFGTRHRAAIGLTENTDALVIVVSEERGDVTLAHKGDFRPMRSRDELLEALRAHGDISNHVWRGSQGGKFELVATAVVSLLFITGIWFSFTQGMHRLVTMEVPIEYMNRNPAMEILDTSFNAVRLDLSGSGALIRSLRPDQVIVRIDLNKGSAGINTFPIKQENISLPPGILLNRVEPPSIDVTLDVPMKKVLPIQVQWVGKLPPPFLVAEAKVNPERIQLIGGTRLLENLETIYTEAVPLESLDPGKKEGRLSAKVILDHPSLKLANGSLDKVQVVYVIKKRVRVR
jgi:uncharacterized protein (TIGR00159 family)